MNKLGCHKGFTVIELLITIVIVALLLALAVPSFTETIRRNRMATQANDLLMLVMLARSEAIKRNDSVSLNLSVDADDRWQANVTDSDGDVIRTIDNSDFPVTLTSDSDMTVTYNASGNVDAANTFTLNHDGEGVELRRCVEISITGRAEVLEKGACPS